MWIISRVTVLVGLDVDCLDWQANYNPVAYIGNPRLGTALQLLQTTDYVESKLAEASHSCYTL